MSASGFDAPEVPLPPVQVAMLEPATLARLFDDLARDAILSSAQIRAPGSVRGEAAPPSLAEARQRFESGSVQGLQLRYRLGATSWCDTLLRTAEGVRLVRIEQPPR